MEGYLFEYSIADLVGYRNRQRVERNVFYGMRDGHESQENQWFAVENRGKNFVQYIQF